MKWIDKFYNHIDECDQCRNNPRTLCATGEHYMKMHALQPGISLNEDVKAIFSKHERRALREIREVTKLHQESDKG